MGNHGYITLEKEIFMSDIHELTNKIIKERFKNKLKMNIFVEESEPGKFSDCLSVEILANDGTEEQITIIWLTDEEKNPIGPRESSKHIEFRHPRGDPFWWAEIILMNQIAHHLKGKISDDGTDGEWEPDIDKYPTYRMWAERWRKRSGKKLNWFEKRYINKSIREIVEYYGDLFADAPKDEVAFGPAGVLVE